MKIAVISDMHIGPSTKAQDFCPRKLLKNNPDRFDGLVEGFVKDFYTFIEESDIRADYLLVCGDITDDAHPEEVKIASEFLKKARDHLHVPEQHMFFVPGNHDADWTFFDENDSTGIKWAQRYVAFNYPQFVFNDVNNLEGSEGCLFENNYFKLWRNEDLVVLGYNSSSTDTKDAKVHCGEIVQKHLVEIDTVLKAHNLKDDHRVKVCVVHHHLRNFPLPKPSNRDYSIAVNAEGLLELMGKYKFDFLVHGHRHHSYFSSHSHPVPILAAGSFSVSLGTELEGLSSNQFHLIEMEKTENDKVVGVVKSWSHNALGWSKSEECKSTRCLGHLRPFGYTLSDSEVARKFKESIRKTKETGKQCFFLRRDVMRICKEVDFLIEMQSEIHDWCKEYICCELGLDIKMCEDGDIIFISKEPA